MQYIFALFAHRKRYYMPHVDFSKGLLGLVFIVAVIVVVFVVIVIVGVGVRVRVNIRVKVIYVCPALGNRKLTLGYDERRFIGINFHEATALLECELYFYGVLIFIDWGLFERRFRRNNDSDQRKTKYLDNMEPMMKYILDDRPVT